MPQTIECPSGLTGEIRGLKVRELNILADRRLAKDGGQVDAILASCWTQTLEPGPYDFGDKTIDWDKALQGDRFYTLLKIRGLSLGSTYPFGAVCQNDGCRHRFEWEVSLEDLPVRPLSRDACDTFRAGNRFEAMLPIEGKRVWFGLPTGADERRFARIRRQNRNRLWSAMLAMRVREIEGVKSNDKRQFIEDLEIADAEHLRAELERADCGVQTTIEIECPECLNQQDVDLPFDQNFFLAKPKAPSGSSAR